MAAARRNAAGERWPAPAKLNLFLRVLGRRPDGYHDLQTLFQFLDHGDELEFEPRPGGAIELTRRLPGVPEEADLCVRAARRLRAAAGSGAGVRITVHKAIPLGAGLGGGSSDAATTLVALNRIWGLGLDVGALAALGLGLGADVPVFVRGRAAWAEGVGERLTAVTPPRPWYLVVHPGCHVATAAVFGDKALTRDSSPQKLPGFLLEGIDEGAAGLGRLRALGGNDCEAVVVRRYPAVAEALARVAAFAPPRMSGTGAGVFAAFAERAAALAAQRSLPERWWSIVARGVNESPLVARLAREDGAA